VILFKLLQVGVSCGSKFFYNYERQLFEKVEVVLSLRKDKQQLGAISGELYCRVLYVVPEFVVFYWES
jgi:hypothetical protein